MDSALQPAVGNRLLAALPPGAFAQLLPGMRVVPLTLRDILHGADAPVEAVYFPRSGWVSMVASLEDGQQAEVGIVGREGMVGMTLLSGVETAFVEAMVQGTGTALRMESAAFRRALDEVPALRPLLLRYGEAFHAQVAQTAACNGNHGLEQRLARWLLTSRDRADGDEMQMTQEFLAVMLCVHRPSVTVAARILQRANLIRYGNGVITILDRPGLEAASCECYGMVKRRYQRLLG